MKCFVINLDRSVDRISKMQSQFDKYSLDFLRVSGVDGRLLSPEYLEEIIDPIQRLDYPMTAAEVGCFLSHKRCLELFLEGEDHFAAIFEDDVTLCTNIARYLIDDDWIPVDADIVKIDTNNTIVALKDLQSLGDNDHYIAQMLNKHLCTGGYIISRIAAKKILLSMVQVSAPIDNLMFDPQYQVFLKFKVYQIVPALCMQIDADSLIEADRKLLKLEYKKRPSLPILIWRELTRPFKRNAHIISPINIWARLTTNTRWMRVPFKQ